MSGPTMTETQQATGSRPNGADGAASTADPAASLRALALSTLKRRKVNPANSTDLPASLPQRPTPDSNSIQLDYGTEDSSTGVSEASSSSTVPSAATKPPPSAPPPPSTAMDTSDDQAREEGEISDSETTPPPPPPPVKPPQSPPKTVPAKPQPLALNLPVKPASTSSAMGFTQTLAIETAIRPLAPLVPAPQVQPVAAIRQFTPSSDHEIAAVTSDFQIRPGLQMSQAAYDAAKDILLDLLGWGVPPDYLLNCGLSRELIYYIFIDFNLRLPANLDTTGLPPVATLQPLRYASPEPISPPVASSSRQRSQSNPASRTSAGHHSLPQKPSAPQGVSQAEGSALSATAASFVPGSSSTSATPMQSSPSSPSTIDLELQRRQELQARKAVLASRKSKSASGNAATPRATLELRLSEPKDVDMTPPASSVPTETVDDFLKTIGSVGDGLSSQDTRDDDMDVDEPIPGLSSFPVPPRRDNKSPVAPQIRSQSISSATSPNTVAFPAISVGNSMNQPTSRSSAELEPARRSQSRQDERSDAFEPQIRETSVGLKRGGKRPVAADFVDMDPGPSSRSLYVGHHDYHQGHRHGHHSRRRPQSFAGLTGTRRMVINLSDTSDDEDEDEPDAKRQRREAHHRSRHLPRLGSSATVPVIGTTISLEEKEKEIQKMKELIALREKARLEKLAANSVRSTPPTPAIGEQIKQITVIVKEEDDDAAVSASLNPATLPYLETGEDTKRTGDIFPVSESSSFQSSASDSATPTDDILQLQAPTGDQAFSAQAEQEQLARAPSPQAMSSSSSASVEESRPAQDDLDVGAVSSWSETSSTQIIEIQLDSPKTDFASYRSPLSSYPLLRAHSPRYLLDPDPAMTTHFSTMADESYSTTRPDSSDPSVLTGVNLRAMKAVAVNRWLSDPSRRICQYEVPGGGECRDSNCEDIHPSMAWSVEPSDHETAQHLFAALPQKSQVTLEQLQAALQEARQPDIGYHMRVRDALELLGLRTAP